MGRLVVSVFVAEIKRRVSRFSFDSVVSTLNDLYRKIHDNQMITAVVRQGRIEWGAEGLLPRN